MTPECRQLREDILRISNSSGHGHIPTCFSIVESLYALYETVNHDPGNPAWDERDIFILSKGHAALALYCVLARKGYFDIDKVYAFGAFGSTFGCHVDRLKAPGIEASTGSLGHGVGIAAGAALALKIQKSPRRVFTVVGDGEANEGSVWEAVMVAVDQKLDNLTIIYDNNMSHSRGLQIHSPEERFRAFGCETVEVNGHDVEALKEELAQKGETVRAVVAKTDKGHGSKTLMENHYAWHRRSPNKEELETLIRELDEAAV